MEQIYKMFDDYEKNYISIETLQKLVINFIIESNKNEFLRGYEVGKEEVLCRIKQIIAKEV